MGRGLNLALPSDEVTGSVVQSPPVRVSVTRLQPDRMGGAGYSFVVQSIITTTKSV